MYLSLIYHGHFLVLEQMEKRWPIITPFSESECSLLSLRKLTPFGFAKIPGTVTKTVIFANEIPVLLKQVGVKQNGLRTISKRLTVQQI